MIDEGITQIEVRMNGGSKTITIPIDRDVLRNTIEVVPALGPLCPDAARMTLKELTYITLSKKSADLALRISVVVLHPFSFALTCF